MAETLQQGDGGRWPDMRVLVAFEDLYRTYRETIAAAIRVLRPHLEVTTTGLHDLEAEVARRDTRVVISSQERPAYLRPGATWLEVPLEAGPRTNATRSEEHTSELQSRQYLVCRLLLEKKTLKTVISSPYHV